ncbi:hypothetical protein MCEMAEM6B_01743 [Mycobacteriaceae bacterium]
MPSRTMNPAQVLIRKISSNCTKPTRGVQSGVVNQRAGRMASSATATSSAPTIARCRFVGETTFEIAAPIAAPGAATIINGVTIGHRIRSDLMNKTSAATAPASTATRLVPLASCGPSPKASSTGKDSAEPADARVLANARPTPANSRTSSSAVGDTALR